MVTKTSPSGGTSGSLLIARSLLMLLVVLPAVLMLYFGSNWLLRSHSMAIWPGTEGIVESFDAEIDSGPEHTNYWVSLSYRYEVNGVAYTSTAYDVTANRSTTGWHLCESQAEQEQLVSWLSSVATVDVFYNPDQPFDSVLSKDAPVLLSWIQIVLGTIFGLFGIYGVFRIKLAESDTLGR